MIRQSQQIIINYYFAVIFAFIYRVTQETFEARNWTGHKDVVVSQNSGNDEIFVSNKFGKIWPECRSLGDA